MRQESITFTIVQWDGTFKLDVVTHSHSVDWDTPLSSPYASQDWVLSTVLMQYQAQKQLDW